MPPTEPGAPVRLSRGRLTADLVLAGLFALVCLPFALMGNGVDPIALVLFTGALAVRRWSPGGALVVAWVAAILQMVALSDLQLYDAAVLGVLYSTAAHGGRTVKWVGLASAVVGAFVATFYLGVVKTLFDGAADPDPSGGPVRMLLLLGILFVGAIAVLVLAWTAGLLVRAVRDGRDIRRREESATRERELAEYRFVVEQERNRIARDMHDVVAHSLAVVIAQADGARFAARTRPEAATEALGTIAGVARGALGDVRLLLAELRHAEGETPQPVLDDLGELVERMQAAGLEVRRTESGNPVPLGAGHQIAVYRIIQEALTNALRHGATDRPVTLDLAWSASGVVVRVVNDLRRVDGEGDGDAGGAGGAAAGGGTLRHGIAGMRERAQLAGGALRVETDDTRFVVRADIPASIPAAPAPRPGTGTGAGA